MSEALAEVAKENGIDSVTAVALAYVMSKAPYVFPIIGGRKVEHLMDNIQALKIKLTEKQIEYLESINPFEPGFPNNFVSPNCTITWDMCSCSCRGLAFEPWTSQCPLLSFYCNRSSFRVRVDVY